MERRGDEQNGKRRLAWTQNFVLMRGKTSGSRQVQIGHIQALEANHTLVSAGGVEDSFDTNRTWRLVLQLIGLVALMAGPPKSADWRWSIRVHPAATPPSLPLHPCSRFVACRRLA